MCEEVAYIRQFPQPNNFDHSEDLWKRNFNDSFVVINCSSKNIYYPEHWTPFSIKCAFNGKEHYKLGNKTYSVYNNSFLLLNEGNVYSSYIQSDTTVESLSLNFTRKNMQTFASIHSTKYDAMLDDPFTLSAGDLNFYDKLYEYTPALLHYINLFRQQLQQSIIDRNLLNELAYLSLSELVQLHTQTLSQIDNMAAKKRSTREELYKRLSIAKDHIYSCYNENITLDKLAAISLLNPVYLLREFKKLFGYTPHQYLTATRLKHAREQVIQTKKSISDILTETGFLDISSFSKLFKHTFLLSPQAYRTAFAKK